MDINGTQKHTAKWNTVYQARLIARTLDADVAIDYLANLLYMFYDRDAKSVLDTSNMSETEVSMMALTASALAYTEVAEREKLRNNPN